MQEKVTIFNVKWSENARMHIVRWKCLYAHQLNTKDTVHFECKLQIQNGIRGEEWRWELTSGQIQSPS